MKRGGFKSACLILGVLLVLCALLLLIWGQITAKRNDESAREYADMLISMTASPESALLGDRSDARMPALSVDGTDFVGLLAFEGEERPLPVCGDLENRNKLPCVYGGNLYDGSLIVDGIGREGQLPVGEEYSVGQKVTFTDMTGDRFSFEITEILVREDPEEYLDACKSDFTVIVRNPYGKECRIVFCTE